MRATGLGVGRLFAAARKPGVWSRSSPRIARAALRAHVRERLWVSGFMRFAVPVFAASLTLAGCGGDPVDALAKAKPAVGEPLVAYAADISETVDLAANADLVQRFCANGVGGPCPVDIVARLKEAGFANGGTGVDLAHIFTVLVADKRDGVSDFSSSDEDYLFAAYHVALGRDPDAGGAKDNLSFIQDTGERKTMLRSLLESEEFKRQT